MYYSIHTSDMKEKVFECHYNTDGSNGKIDDKIRKFDFRFASGIARVISFDGIAINVGSYKSKEDFSLCGITDTPSIELHVNFKGTTVGKIKRYSDEVVMQPDDCNLFYCDSTEGVFRSQKDQEYYFICIHILPDFFENLVDTCADLFSPFLNSVGKRDYLALIKENIKVTPEMKNIVLQIINCKMQGRLRQVYLKSKITELLILFADRIDNRIGSFSFSKGDKERIHTAREILIEDIQNPPTLSQLARRSGLNEFKLKKGFKEEFGNTVYGYLLEHKLDKARIMLQEKENSISEIAFITGYSCAAHFSTAFRKRFGFTPSTIR
ncbi:MAG: helix-turn-helix transcriptional regulator [Rhodothermaceae bacterium]